MLNVACEVANSGVGMVPSVRSVKLAPSEDNYGKTTQGEHDVSSGIDRLSKQEY